MGISPFSSCTIEPCNPAAIAPNPKPDRFVITNRYDYKNAHVLIVRYLDCTNYEGVKVLLYEGEFVDLEERDPHFSDGYSPLARFKPTQEGLGLAFKMAEQI